MNDWDDTLLDQWGLMHAHDMTKGHLDDADGFCWCEPEEVLSFDLDGSVISFWVHQEVH